MTERSMAANSTTPPPSRRGWNRTSGPTLEARIGLIALGLYGALLGVAHGAGVGVEQAVADPQETTGLRLLGIVSTVGVLFWAGMVTVCVLAASIPTDRADPLRRFFRASAAVTTMLLLDDLLLVHEFADDMVGYFVDFDHTRGQKDLLELFVFAGYGVIVGLYLIRHRKTIATTRHLPLRLAAIGLATSLVIDMGFLDSAASTVALEVSSRTETIVEEGAKLVGISYLGLYFFDAARSTIGNPRRSPPS